MDINILREAVTVASFAAFMGVVWYALHPGNGKRFEEAANLPLGDDDPLPRETGQTWETVSQVGGIDK